MRQKLTQLSRGVEQSKIRAVTRRIEAVGGINLGQGTCHLPPNAAVLQAAKEAIDHGHNSYTLFDGIPSLKEALVQRYRAYNKMAIKSDNVLVTCGATGAFETICKCFLEPGDEVVMFEPMYQYHLKHIAERGAIPRYVQLRVPDWSFDIGELEAAISKRTKFFVLTNPHNPCGKVFTREELVAIGNCCKDKGVIVVTDEVYEFILGENLSHISLASLPGMFENTLTTSSASKTFFVTGWRVGWIVAPEEIMEPLGVRSDETYVCAPAPLQHAIAYGLGLGDDFFAAIRLPFNRKRDQLSKALIEAGFKPHNPEGAYYTLADYTALGFKDDESAMVGLIDRCGVGAVPGNAFFPTQEQTGLLRFCFALTDEPLNRACDMLTGRIAVLQK